MFFGDRGGKKNFIFSKITMIRVLARKIRNFYRNNRYFRVGEGISRLEGGVSRCRYVENVRTIWRQSDQCCLSNLKKNYQQNVLILLWKLCRGLRSLLPPSPCAPSFHQSRSKIWQLKIAFGYDVAKVVLSMSIKLVSIIDRLIHFVENNKNLSIPINRFCRK